MSRSMRAGPTGSTSRPGQSIYEGQSRMLAQGIVSLTLTSGVKLTLEAPVAFSPVSGDLVELSGGKLVGFVPDGAEGFTINAPGMVVVDLGTEFAVDADRSSGSRVLVLDGSVRLEPPSGLVDGSGFAVEEILAGQARKADAGGGALAVGDAEPTAFYREVPPPYERMIRDAGPLAYWRFNERDEAGAMFSLGALGGDIADIAQSMIRRNNTPPVCEDGDAALFLDWEDGGLYPEGVGVSDGLIFTEDFTIEAWIFVPVDTSRRMRFVSNNMLDESGMQSGGFCFGVTGAGSDIAQAGGPVLMFTSCSVFDAFSETPVPTERWVHVAASIDSRRGVLRMMIDGKPVPLRVNDERGYVQHPGYDGQLFVPPSTGVVRVGDALAQFNITEEHWTGGIDELAIYASVLDTETLAAHAAIGEQIAD